MKLYNVRIYTDQVSLTFDELTLDEIDELEKAGWVFLKKLSQHEGRYFFYRKFTGESDGSGRWILNIGAEDFK